VPTNNAHVIQLGSNVKFIQGAVFNPPACGFFGEWLRNYCWLNTRYFKGFIEVIQQAEGKSEFFIIAK